MTGVRILEVQIDKDFSMLLALPHLSLSGMCMLDVIVELITLISESSDVLMVVASLNPSPLTLLLLTLSLPAKSTKHSVFLPPYLMYKSECDLDEASFIRVSLECLKRAAFDTKALRPPWREHSTSTAASVLDILELRLRRSKHDPL
jgi:hypothetical protein